MILSFVLVVVATSILQIICVLPVMFLVHFGILCIIGLVFIPQILLVLQIIFFSLVTQQVLQKLDSL